ncbi:MAG: hypothetical protein IKO76_06565 [Butyrivibrio sp.]|nr:hypothetical protein [Butyrivibrio sp.]
MSKEFMHEDLNNYTTLNRDFFEKLIIALHEVPDGILRGIQAKKKMRIILDYDPQKDYIEIIKAGIAGQDQMEKKMPRYLMDRFGLLRYCGRKGKTQIIVNFDNDSGEGVMEVMTEDTELLLSKGVEKLREEYGDKLAP